MCMVKVGDLVNTMTIMRTLGITFIRKILNLKNNNEARGRLCPLPLLSTFFWGGGGKGVGSICTRPFAIMNSNDPNGKHTPWSLDYCDHCKPVIGPKLRPFG